MLCPADTSPLHVTPHDRRSETCSSQIDAVVFSEAPARLLIRVRDGVEAAAELEDKPPPEEQVVKCIGRLERVQ